MDPDVFAALAEPNRRKMLEFLGESPRSVGEVAGAIGLRQPTATKHLQALERAGLVTAHPLGRRRIYALERPALLALRDWADGLAGAVPSDGALTAYARALREEEDRAAAGTAADPREMELEQRFALAPAELWDWWTDPVRVAQWWAPDHFTVAEAEVDPRVGGALNVVMAEGDGTRHRADGRFLALDRPRALAFEMGPLGPTGEPLFRSTHQLAFTQAASGATRLAMRITVDDIVPGAESALAGMRIGWGQTLARLAALLA